MAIFPLLNRISTPSPTEKNRANHLEQLDKFQLFLFGIAQQLDTLNVHAQDNWEALIAIAECAGQDWLERAWYAALTLSGDTTAQSVSNELLANIQTVFAHKRVEKISTVDLLHALCEDEEVAWNTYNHRYLHIF